MYVFNETFLIFIGLLLCRRGIFDCAMFSFLNFFESGKPQPLHNYNPLPTASNVMALKYFQLEMGRLFFSERERDQFDAELSK